MASPLSVRKNNYIENPKRADIPTPLWLCAWLRELIAPIYRAKTILDPSAGDSRLTRGWGADVVEYEIKRGADFLAATGPVAADMVLCNPPFNLGVGRRLGSEVFLEKIIELCGPTVPIVLMVPMGFRLNQRLKSSRIEKIANLYPKITSVVSVPLDAYETVLFHNEILFFNMPKLAPHYVALPPSMT
jgi:hypothetical protein